MKFLILIHSKPASRALWEGLSGQARMDFGRGHLALTGQLAEAGELIASEGLEDIALAKLVRVREGRTITTDGPFAEVKEYLAGFYLIECDTIEQAVERAALAPDAAYGEVEVRPVLDMSDWEL